MSGSTPYCSMQDIVPVLPVPHITSSVISNTSYLSQISLMILKYPSGAGTPLSAVPTTGSAMKAATVSGPAFCISSSRA